MGLLARAVTRSFLLLDSEWSVEHAGRLVRSVGPSHVIVARRQAGDYYLARRATVSAMFAAAAPAATVWSALDLAQTQPTPTRDGYTADDPSVLEAVVLEEGRLIGFLDRRPLTSGDLDADATLTGALGGELFYSFDTDFLRGFDTTPGAAGAADGAPSPPALVHDFPDQVALGSTTSLVLWLSADPRAGTRLNAALPVGTNVDVVVLPCQGFKVVGDREDTLSVPDQGGESEPVRIKLQATQAGQALVRVHAYVGTHHVGTLLVESMVVPAVVPSPATSTAHRVRLPLLQHLDDAPDLLLSIIERSTADTVSLTITLRSRQPVVEGQPLSRQFGPKVIAKRPQPYIQQFFKAVQHLDLREENDRRLLETKCAALTSAVIPPELLEDLWQLRGRVQSVEIESEEPWIPWELCRLAGRNGDGIEDGGFFGDAFPITRWLPQVEGKLRLSLRKMALVAPVDSGLLHAPDEASFIRSLQDTGRQVQEVKADLLSILKAMTHDGYDAWHFVGHGRANDNPDWSELALEANDVIRPENLSGTVENVGRTNPLVFLNACTSGLGGLTLSGSGGWAERFLRAGRDFLPDAGAAAFVGTYWMVDDGLALQFVKAFYRALLVDGHPIGQAAFRARQALRDSGDPTRLAYTVFANPLARVEAHA